MKTLVSCLVGVLALCALASCSGDSSNNAAKAATTVPPTAVKGGDAAIDTFTVASSAACNGKTSVTVAVDYKISGAKKAELSVDGRPQALDSMQGSVSPVVHCDTLPHTIVLVAYDSQNRKTAEQKLVVTTL
jgi:hypothetical protein